MPRVPSVLLVLALLLAPLAVSAPTPIAAPQKREAAGIQRKPVAAASANDFLAAWEDSRAYHYSSPVHGTGPEVDIYATRIGLDGAAQSEGGVPVNPRAGDENSPAVVWNGSEYVVIHNVPYHGGGVSVTRVLPDRLAEPKLVPANVEYAHHQVAAWNGSRYLVVRSGPTLRALVINDDFDLVTPELELSAAGSGLFLPAVASDGADFLVVSLAEQPGDVLEVNATVVSSEGGVRRSVTIATFRRDPTLPHSAPAVAWNGTSYLVVWSSGVAVRGRLIRSDGEAASGELMFATTSEVEVFDPDVAWNGSIFLVTFSYRNEWDTPLSFPVTNLYAARVSPDGVLIDAPYPLTISVTPGAQDASAVAALGETFIVLWQEEGDVVSATVDATTGAVGSQQSISRSILRQENARGVFDGANLAFVWAESANWPPGAEPIVLFGRVTPDGRYLDGGGVAVGRGRSGVIVAGEVYLVTWHTYGGIAEGVRITKDGRILDDVPFRLPATVPMQYPVSLGPTATDGSTFVSVGSGSRVTADGITSRYLLSWTIGSAGPPSAPVEIVPIAEFDQLPIAVAWAGSRYLLLYHQLLGPTDCHRCYPARELRGVILDPSGRAVGPSMHFGVHAAGVSTHLAGGGGHYLFASGLSDDRTRYTIVNEAGSVVAESMIAGDPIDVAWDGRAFVISLRRAEGSGPYGVRFWGENQRVGANGEPIGAPSFIETGGAMSWMLIPARGTVAALFPYIHPFTFAHDAGIIRYAFAWESQRRRAVGR